MHVLLGRVIENKYYSTTGYIDVLLPQTLEEMGGEKQFSKEFDLYNFEKDLSSGIFLYFFKFILKK